jgi:hypothetical protein
MLKSLSTTSQGTFLQKKFQLCIFMYFHLFRQFDIQNLYLFKCDIFAQIDTVIIEQLLWRFCKFAFYWTYNVSNR